MSKNRNNDSTFEIDKPHICILYTYYIYDSVLTAKTSNINFISI